MWRLWGMFQRFIQIIIIKTLEVDLVTYQTPPTPILQLHLQLITLIIIIVFKILHTYTIT